MVSAKLRVLPRDLTWPHPEWWSLGLCAVAWTLMLWKAASTPLGMPVSHGHTTYGMALAGLPDRQVAWSAEAFWWIVMVVAMMFPMIVDPIRATASRSLWRRRHRAIVGFLAGYTVPWILFGIAAYAAIAMFEMDKALQPGFAAAMAFGAAVIWQVMPVKRRAVMACHRTQPIAPTGWHADRDCVTYGLMVGRSCLVSCWALMLACMLAEHSIPALVGVTAIGWVERNKRRPDQLLLCAIIAVLAMTCLVAPRV